MPTVFKAHHAYVPCSIYLLDYCFQQFFFLLFNVVFVYETLKRRHGLRRQTSIRALISSLLHIAPSDAILNQQILSVARSCGYGKQWFVGKVPRNYQKTCAHKESVPSSVPEYKVETLYSGTGTVPEF